VHELIKDKQPDEEHKHSWLWTSPISEEYSIIRSPDERDKVALLGIMSDEDAVFRDNTFKGVPIGNVLDAFLDI
jgi:hypothetical protein